MLCVIQYTCTRIYRDKCGEIKTALLEEGTLGLLHFFFQLLHKPKTFHNKNLGEKMYRLQGKVVRGSARLTYGPHGNHPQTAASALWAQSPHPKSRQ